MSISNQVDLRLKLGNLLLALVLSTVPTAMTIGFLSIHGVILCKSLDKVLITQKNNKVQPICFQKNLESTYNYIVWIWLITMLPTWRWLYVGHYRKVQSKQK